MQNYEKSIKFGSSFHRKHFESEDVLAFRFRVGLGLGKSSLKWRREASNNHWKSRLEGGKYWDRIIECREVGGDLEKSNVNKNHLFSPDNRLLSLRTANYRYFNRLPLYLFLLFKAFFFIHYSFRLFSHSSMHECTGRDAQVAARRHSPQKSAVL